LGCRVYGTNGAGPARLIYLHGTREYESGEVKGGSDDPDFLTVTRRLGWTVEVLLDLRISDCSQIEIVSDGFILCLTDNPADPRMRARFGTHCVEIRNPEAFLTVLTARVVAAAISLALFVAPGQVLPVTYGTRTYSGPDLAPDLFARKPPDLAYEREHRLIWLPYSRLVDALPERLRVTCYASAPFLRRIS
jgi:hypothetical protein